MQVPDTWQLVALGALDTAKRRTIDPEEYPEEQFEYYSIPAYQEKQAPIVSEGGDIASVKLLLEPGSILFGKLNPRVEKVWRVRPSSGLRQIGSTEWLPIVPTEKVSPDFLYFLCWSDSVMRVAKGQVSGSTPSRQRVDPAAFYRIRVPLPPLAEQRQIAAVLSAVQRAIEHHERLIDVTAELKKALMHKLFTEGTCGEPVKHTEIGPIPASWVLERCDELCDEISVGVVVRPRSYYVDRGVPAFRSLNVREDRLATDQLVYFSKEVNDGTLSKSKLRAGDVLIVRTGYPGTSCVVPPDYDGSNCIDIVFARPGPRITSDYLSRFLNSEAGKDQATAAKHGLAQQHLNVGAVKRVQIPLPTLKEQTAIVEALAAVDAKRGVHLRAAEVLGVLFRTLLHQLMTAQVRVHDLDLSALDESVAELAGAM